MMLNGQRSTVQVKKKPRYVDPGREMRMQGVYKPVSTPSPRQNAIPGNKGNLGLSNTSTIVVLAYCLSSVPGFPLHARCISHGSGCRSTTFSKSQHVRCSLRKSRFPLIRRKIIRYTSQNQATVSTPSGGCMLRPDHYSIHRTLFHFPIQSQPRHSRREPSGGLVLDTSQPDGVMRIHLAISASDVELWLRIRGVAKVPAKARQGT